MARIRNDETYSQRGVHQHICTDQSYASCCSGARILYSVQGGFHCKNRQISQHRENDTGYSGGKDQPKVNSQTCLEQSIPPRLVR